jgi:hypothetical protein
MYPGRGKSIRLVSLSVSVVAGSQVFINLLQNIVNHELFHRCHPFVHCVGFGLRACARLC